MEISGISDEKNRPLITQSRKDERYIGQEFPDCKGFVQLLVSVGLIGLIFGAIAYDFAEITW